MKITSPLTVKRPMENQRSKTSADDPSRLKVHKCDSIEKYRTRTHPHIPDGHFKKYSTYSHKRMSLQTDAQNIARVVLSQKAEARESLRSKLPGSFASLYTCNEQKDQPNHKMTLGEKIESRPPFCSDLDVPSPTTYTPINKPLNETNSPIYSFGSREADKTGGGRMAWGRPYMRSVTPYTYKGDYEKQWPTLANYTQPSGVSKRQVLTQRKNYPSYSLGKRPTNDLWSSGRGTPAANHYHPEEASLYVRRTAPLFTMRPTLHQKAPMNVPPPDNYNIPLPPKGPAYSFDTSKRFIKRHETGPYMAT